MNFSEKQFQDHFYRLLTLYKRERPTSGITEDDMKLLMLVYPGVLVAQADGFIDTAEMVVLVRLAKEDLANDFNLRISDSIKDELRYLIQNTTLWYEHIISTLKFYIAANDKAVEIADIMVLVAGCSSGDLVNNLLYTSKAANSEGVLNKENPAIEFLSETERMDIKRLARVLGLYNSKAAAERLAIQLEEPEQAV